LTRIEEDLAAKQLKWHHCFWRRCASHCFFMRHRSLWFWIAEVACSVASFIDYRWIKNNPKWLNIKHA